MAEKDEDLIKSLQEKNLEQSLYKARKIFLWSDVNDESAKAVVTRLLSLDTEDPKEEIVLYINSPGGSVSDGMAIYDAMQAISAPVSTVCMGMAMSMGSFLLAAGEPGRRFAWPHARIMIHQPSGGFQGQHTDIEIQAKEISRIRSILDGILANHSGKAVNQVNKDTERDHYMTGEEAKKYGLIDNVISNREEVKKDGKDKK